MTDERDEIRMSQFADGELPSDQANELLLDVLDEPCAREKLRGLLRLRQATAGWRTSQPPKPVMIAAERPRTFRTSRAAWRAGGLAVAACIGGLLVLSGVWAAGRRGSPHQWQGAPIANRPPAAALVSPEQMQQVAKAFELHESVAGPLAWYAADDRSIRLASAQGTEAGQAAIGVLLKLESAEPVAAPRTYVIVCRNDQPAVIRFPAEHGDRQGLRVYLTPRAVNGKLDVSYAIAMDGQSEQAPSASLSGRRNLGLAGAPLGQLAMGEKLLSVEAAAWAIPQEHD